MLDIDPYIEEGRANALLIQFMSTLLNISSLNCSLVYEDSRLAMRIEEIDYEELFLKIERILAKLVLLFCLIDVLRIPEEMNITTKWI